MTSKDNRQIDKPTKAILGFLLAWIVPGAGHAFVGRPGRGIIIFVVIGATFWGGIAMGGVMTVDHQRQKWWFAAEMLTGIHGLIGWRRESKQLQALNDEIQVDMAEERGRLERSIRERQDEHATCERQIAEIERSIRAATTAEEESALIADRKTLLEGKTNIKNALDGYRSQMYSMRNNYIEKVLAQKNLALVAPMATVARAYAGVAGLLNLMCMFDVLMLALIGTVATPEPSSKEDDH
ncbi:MAG: hypothetical protein QGH60_17105 [Phycisphaerae bacterium]|jgi:TM2 domain-containing membrane protein YozV|nr:hypothetical protein [Phycisphaerae bacterium]